MVLVVLETTVQRERSIAPNTPSRTITNIFRYLAEELEDDEREAGEAWGPMLNGGRSTSVVVQESFERGGGPLEVGDIVGVGSQSWWKKTKPKQKISIMASDKEAVGVVAREVRTQEVEIQQVTERMLENANVHAERV